MNVLIGLLIFASFLQTSFVGVNLILLLIIARSFVVESRSNYLLAFAFGILVGILSAQNMGTWPLILLITVKIAHLIRKLPFSMSVLTFMPVVILSLLFSYGSEYLFLNQSIDWVKAGIELAVSIPVYAFIRFWEERFYNHPTTVRLKMRK